MLKNHSMLYVINMVVDTTDIILICNLRRNFLFFQFSDKFHFVNSKLYNLPSFTNV